MLRAPESGEVSATVRGWLTGQGYGAVADGAPPERLSGGAGFWVYGLRFAGPGLPPQWSVPLVARVPAAAQRGFFGSEPRLPAGLTGWAAREFRRAAPGTG